MNTVRKQLDDIHPASRRTARRPALLIVLAVVLLAESALLFGVTAWLIFETAGASAASLYSGIALIVSSALAAVWVLAIGLATVRMHSWIRAAAITWQVVQLAIAVGSFEGLDATPRIGLALLIPSIVVILLVLSPSVTAVTHRAVVR